MYTMYNFENQNFENAPLIISLKNQFKQNINLKKKLC